MPSPSTFPRQQKTPSESRRRVTDVVGRVEAQAFTTTTAGDQVALYCHTATGTVVVRGPLAAFIASARADRDANGQPFRRPCSSLAVLEADAAASAYVPPTETGKITRTRMTPERLARIEAAACSIIANPELRPRRVAEEIREPLSTLYATLGRLRRQARPPVLKPGGAIL